MRRDDPLDDLEWTFLDRLMAEHEISPERIAELRTATRTLLDRVADFLDNPPPRRSLDDIPTWSLAGGFGLAAEDVPRPRRSVVAWQTPAAPAAETSLRRCSA